MKLTLCLRSRSLLPLVLLSSLFWPAPRAAGAPPARKPAAAAVAASGEAINDDMKQRISNGISLSPIIGVDPTYGLLLGGAFFRGDTIAPMSNLDLFFYATLKSVYGIEGKLTFWNRTDSYYKLEFEASNFFDAYFGEGNLTAPSAQVNIDIFKTVLNPSIWKRWTRQLSTGILAELRYRNETGVAAVSGRQVFGNDFTPVIGFAVNYDTRDHTILTKTGQYYQAKLDYGPSLLSSRAGAVDFVRLELESRHFMKATESIVLAGQLTLGTAFGDPGYQYRFTLGGSRKLRGYQSNRLRGRHYYMAQGESRLNVTNWLGFVGFLGVGDTADVNLGDFGRPKLTGGLGLRLGLPPDFIARARIDFAFSRDESAFYLNFNEAF